jgi:hypothetical protein
VGLDVAALDQEDPADAGAGARDAARQAPRWSYGGDVIPSPTQPDGLSPPSPAMRRNAGEGVERSEAGG